MEISRQIHSAQGDRMKSFQLPVSKGTILPAGIRQQPADSYFGVGKVRASSANPSRRTIASTRSSIDVSNNNHFMGNKGFYMSDSESPRISGSSILQQQQMQIMQQQQQINMLQKQQMTYDNMRTNNQKLNFTSEMIAAKPPSGIGGRNIQSAGGIGYSGGSTGGGMNPSPRTQLSQYTPLPPGSTALSLAGTGSNMYRHHVGTNNGNSSGSQNGAANNNSNSSNGNNLHPQLSSSLPLPQRTMFALAGQSAPDSNNNNNNGSGGGSEAVQRCSSASPVQHPGGGGSESDLVSILSTSSASRSGGPRRADRGAKRRVRFADKIATFACVSDFDGPNPAPVAGSPARAFGKGGLRPASANAAIGTGQAAASGYAPRANNNIAAQQPSSNSSGSSGIACVSAQQQQNGVSFTANMSNGTMSFIPQQQQLQFPAETKQAALSTVAATNSIQTAQNTLNNHTNVTVPSAGTSSAPASSGAKKAAPTAAEPVLPSITTKKNTVTASSGGSSNNPIPLLVPPAADAPLGKQGASSTVPVPTAPSVGEKTGATKATSFSGAASSSGSNASSAGKVGATGKRGKPVRPSLSEQLASIGAQAQVITTDIRVKGKLGAGGSGAGGMPVSNGETALYTMPARSFSIGSLSCRYPSPISFYGDRCEYLFNHPFESSVVNMVVYYRDLSAISILGTKFRFKLPKRLACFSADFDPQNPHHCVCVDLASMLSVSVIREKVLPLISQFK